MMQITTGQWYAWSTALLYPLLRVLGLILADPLLGNRSVPVTAKLALALLIAVLVAPLLPPTPAADPATAAGVLIGAQQLLIGLAMGFSIRVALSAAQMAGQLAGLQMGLGFAQFFDPQSGAQSAVLDRFLGLFAVLMFFSIDGHHVVLGALVDSFRALPIAAAPLDALALRVLVEWAGTIFTAGLLIALPVVAALLIANVALGIMMRAAPPLNLFTVGFPVTLITGLLALYLAAPYLGPALVDLFEQATLALGRVLEAFTPDS
ncbi:MAG TPA: flagellar biosynthetic protein FliR [Burkholderiales bacterium]|jgi:flagellar biosynthetic protein FliR